MFSFQEDDGGVISEVGVRLGDVVGEVVAYLVWRRIDFGNKRPRIC